jgi:hypothetical protein
MARYSDPMNVKEGLGIVAPPRPTITTIREPKRMRAVATDDLGSEYPLGLPCSYSSIRKFPN